MRNRNSAACCRYSLEVKPRVTLEKNNVLVLESSWLVSNYVLKADGSSGWAPYPKRWRYSKGVPYVR